MAKKHMSQEEFDTIKELQRLNVPSKTIIQLTGRSHASLSRARHYKTYEDYRKPKEKPQEELPLKSVNDIDTVVKLLENIDNRLKWIEENIPAQGSKKFWLR